MIRQAHTYLAGAISGTALVAGAIVVFVLLVSVQAAKDWPLSGLVGGGGDSGSVSSAQPVAVHGTAAAKRARAPKRPATRPAPAAPVAVRAAGAERRHLGLRHGPGAGSRAGDACHRRRQPGRARRVPARLRLEATARAAAGGGSGSAARRPGNGLRRGRLRGRSRRRRRQRSRLRGRRDGRRRRRRRRRQRRRAQRSKASSTKSPARARWSAGRSAGPSAKPWKRSAACSEAATSRARPRNRHNARLMAERGQAVADPIAGSPVYPLGSRLNERGRLEIGGCDALELAAEFGTPAYVYAEDDLRARARAIRRRVRRAQRGLRGRLREQGLPLHRGAARSSPRRASPATSPPAASCTSRSAPASSPSGSTCTATTSPRPSSSWRSRAASAT